MRLRHLVTIGPRPPIGPELHPDADVTFVPMEAIADGLGGLDISQTRPFSEVVSGSYNYFAEGDVLLAKVTPCFENGKKALAQSLSNGIGYATSEVHVIRPGVDRIHPKYLFYLLCSEDFRAGGIASMTGAGGLRRVSDAAVLNYQPSVTDLPTQQAIAEFLDRETARIEQLIEKKQRLISLLSPRLESLFHVGWEDTSEERVRFKFIAIRSQRQIHLDEADEFTPLGLYNRGRGYFKKEPSPGHELGDSTFFWIQEGDLILSGQFAWEGAIALAGEDADGCVVSHRYPVYVGTRGVLTAYLYAYFRTVNGQFLLDNCSRGAAGRNRPLNANILGREKVPLLPRHIQKEVARLVEQERAIKKVVTASIDRLREFRSLLITAAVTGQIDVSTWGKQGTTDRRLDQIEEATNT